MKRQSYTPTDLVCLECGNVITIARVKKGMRMVGHIKDLWCYKCKCITKHYEVREADKFKMSSFFDDDVSLYVFDLLNKGFDGDYERKDRVFKKVLKR